MDKWWAGIGTSPGQFFGCKQMSKERPWLSEVLRHIAPRIERTQKSFGTLRTPVFNRLSSRLVRRNPSRCSPSPVEAKVWAPVAKAQVYSPQAGDNLWKTQSPTLADEAKARLTPHSRLMTPEIRPATKGTLGSATFALLRGGAREAALQSGTPRETRGFRGEPRENVLVGQGSSCPRRIRNR